MQDDQQDRLKVLCELAANEYDSQKLLELVRQINELLDAMHNRQSETGDLSGLGCVLIAD